MEKQLQQLLQLSANLYEMLLKRPEELTRDEFIEEINSKLDERGGLMEQLVHSGFEYNQSLKLHQTLFELDNGIKERLNIVLQGIKMDMKELQASKKHEQQYSNPYGHVQSMDGMYYDKKK